MKRDYELGFIISPEVNEEETRPLLDRLTQIVAQHDGQVVKINQWGRRRLAYPIKHYRDGSYIFIDLILTPETVSELERTLKVSEIVLRYMVTKRDARAVQKEREEREEREARAAAAAAAKAEAEHQAAPVATSEETSTDSLIVSAGLSSEELDAAPAATDDAETVEV